MTGYVQDVYALLPRPGRSFRRTPSLDYVWIVWTVTTLLMERFEFAVVHSRHGRPPKRSCNQCPEIPFPTVLMHHFFLGWNWGSQSVVDIQCWDISCQGCIVQTCEVEPHFFFTLVLLVSQSWTYLSMRGVGSWSIEMQVLWTLDFEVVDLG